MQHSVHPTACTLQLVLSRCRPSRLTSILCIALEQILKEKIIKDIRVNCKTDKTHLPRVDQACLICYLSLITDFSRQGKCGRPSLGVPQ